MGQRAKVVWLGLAAGLLLVGIYTQTRTDPPPVAPSTRIDGDEEVSVARAEVESSVSEDEDRPDLAATAAARVASPDPEWNELRRARGGIRALLMLSEDRLWAADLFRHEELNPFDRYLDPQRRLNLLVKLEREHDSRLLPAEPASQVDMERVAYEKVRLGPDGFQRMRGLGEADVRGLLDAVLQWFVDEGCLEVDPAQQLAQREGAAIAAHFDEKRAEQARDAARRGPLEPNGR